ncbi:MAG: Trk system potassium transporter TrkA [Acidimicrobiia bacterium]|nr:MAG: Trk system potassium transporter TrkA [Acidimicrobiia bacterium]
MRIVIVGAGAVGSFLAEKLSIEGQDVVVVESDPERAAEAQLEIDCLVINGNGASVETLKSAGLADADLLIAVSSSDAVNVLACSAGTQLNIPRKVARVEDPQLKAEVEALGVDLVIDPGESAARELLQLASSGDIAEMVEFADGDLVLLGAYVNPNAAFVGRTLADLRETVDTWDWLVVAVIRGGRTFVARGATKLEARDHVLMMAHREAREKTYEWLELSSQPAKKVIILGGTRLAKLTASMLANRNIHTTLIDSDRNRCRLIAEDLKNVVTVWADPKDPKILRSEGIEATDVVMALSGWDSENIVGALVAKSLGAREVIARLTNTDLVGLLPGIGIDATVSSRLSAANEILRFVRRGVIHSVATFSDSDVEAIELEVGPGSPAIGKTLADLKLPHSLIIGGVQRGDEAFVPRGNTAIEIGDHLIVIALPEAIKTAEKLSG